MAQLTEWQALLLGLLQGLTEWLPISSSGHLVIAQHFLGVPEGLVAFDLLLHLGTLVAVLAVYRARVAAMAVAVLRGPAAAREAGSWRAAWRGDADLRLAGFVVLGTVPAAAAGLLLQSQVEAAFSSLLVVGLFLVVTGILLLLTRWARPRADATLRTRDAVVVGVAQAFAILPGLSRSGSTIGTGMLGGLDRREAADYSFLLSIPVLVGAAVLEAPRLAELPALGWAPLAIGFAASMAVGYASLRFLVGFVTRHGVRPFGYYCLAVGAIVLGVVAAGRF